VEMKEKRDDAALTGKGVTDACASDKDAMSDVIGTVKEKLHDVAASAADLAGKATEKVPEWASSVSNSAINANDKATQVASATVAKVGELGKDVTALVRRYPVMALVVGVGAGFLLGQVMHRSSSKSA